MCARRARGATGGAPREAVTYRRIRRHERQIPMKKPRSKGSASPKAFHASRRACGFYSLSLPFAAWWSHEESKDMGVRARLLRTHPSWSEHQRVRRAQMGGIMVSAGGHKSDCRSWPHACLRY